jgi:hypothetical protein
VADVKRFSHQINTDEVFSTHTWRTFLGNHADAIAAIDLCVVPTVNFERLFVFLVLGHGRRQLLRFAAFAAISATSALRSHLIQQVLHIRFAKRNEPTCLFPGEIEGACSEVSEVLGREQMNDLTMPDLIDNPGVRLIPRSPQSLDLLLAVLVSQVGGDGCASRCHRR